MKKNLAKFLVNSQAEYTNTMTYFKRVEKRRAKKKIAKKSKQRNRR